MILIGSRALQLRAPFLLNRDPVDFDWICTEEEYGDWFKKNQNKVQPTKDPYSPKPNKMIVEGSTNCEFDFIAPGTSNEELSKLIAQDPETLKTPFGLVPSLDWLFFFKASHKHLKNSPHFWKTFNDYHRMKAAGAKIPVEFKDLFKQREKETYTYKHPNLKQDKKNFFSEDQGITYTYDHDSLHCAVKHLDKPAYSYFGEEGQEVKSNKDKFFQCSKEIQLYSVVEESAVLAIERSLVPHPGVLTIKQAWGLAFSKVLTSITSGWWRTFAYDNGLEALKIYPADYWDKFQSGLKDGTVKPFKR